MTQNMVRCRAALSCFRALRFTTLWLDIVLVFSDNSWKFNESIIVFCSDLIRT